MAKPILPRQYNTPTENARLKTSNDNRRRILRIKLRPDTALGKPPIVDPETGQEYPLRRQMERVRRNRHAQMLVSFTRLVADRTLGQDPWEKLPMETPLQFSRFRAYCQLGPRRTLAQVARQHGVGEDGVRKMSAHLHWPLRAECWDREQDRLEDLAFKQEKLQATRRQARLGMKLQALATRGAENHLATGALDLSPADVARIADVGVKIERLAHDKSTSNEARQGEIRLVWDGPTPKWAGHDQEVVVAHQVERPDRLLSDQAKDKGEGVE